MTACGTNTAGEPTAAPSSASAAPSTSTFANSADEADADRAARARAGLPNSGGITLEDAQAAANRGVPFVFGAGGTGCAWLRLPDGSLYALHDTAARTGSSALVRDRGTEAAFRADPDYEPGRCRPAEGIPTADDPTQPAPYRWVGAYGNTYLRWHGQTFIIPGTVGPGLALRPITSEVIPGVDGVPIPPPAQTPN
ncbi:hypothetical protein TPB0596_00430 [Tsukamurella pulmonis]|nr:hypothetical protein TPB0596_00430 [Tsukamurella pulmonis]